MSEVYKMSLTLKQICDALGISRSRVEQWISRGYFRAPQEPVLGVARDWELVDAVRLALMTQLLDANMTAQQAGALVYVDPLQFNEDETFFVAWQGSHASLIYSNGPNNEPEKMFIPGAWFNELIRRRDLTNFLVSSDVVVSIVINLGALEARISDSLESKKE